MKVIVLGGGNSVERDVSLRSSRAVLEALRSVGYIAELHDLNDSTDNLVKYDQTQTIIFPILHGAGGEDGSIQYVLEQAKLPYLGTNSHYSKLCFDKSLTREILASAGLPIAIGVTVDAVSYPQQKLRLQPHVLKAVGGGSSIGTYVVRNPSQINDAEVAKVFKVSDTAVLEELVEGIEITVPVLDYSALPVIEIILPENGEFDYENKYNGKSQELCPAISISVEVQLQAQKLGEQAHKLLGCRHLSRVDMIIRPSGEMVILEVNTIPGLTDQSLYPKSAEVAGLPFPQLMKRFVELVQRDYNLN